MDLMSILRATAALGIVLAMIWAAMWVLRRYGSKFVSGPDAQKHKQMQVLETLNVPPRHRLVRLRNGDSEHLVFIGPDNSIELTAPAPFKHSTERTE